MIAKIGIESSLPIAPPICSSEVINLLEVLRFNAKEAEEWASMESDESVWSNAVQDVAALTRTIEIIKAKHPNDQAHPTAAEKGH